MEKAAFIFSTWATGFGSLGVAGVAEGHVVVFMLNCTLVVMWSFWMGEEMVTFNDIYNENLRWFKMPPF